MYCKNCGKQIEDQAAVCVHCGVATDNTPVLQNQESNTLGLVGFVLSFFVAIAGLVCSAIAYKRCKENPNLEGKSMALAGIIISSIELGSGILVGLAYVIMAIIMIAVFGSAPM